MFRNYSILFVLLSSMVVAGCTTTEPGTDIDDVKSDIPVQLDTFEAIEDDGMPDTRPDVVTTDQGSDDGNVDTMVDPCAEMPYGFGCICEENPDCASNFCIAMPGENYYRCTMTCYDNCPDGWKCQEINLGGADTTYICRPTYNPLCDRECEFDSDCQSAGAMCVFNGTKKYCHKSCDTAASCESKVRIKECDMAGNCTFDGDKTEAECLDDPLCEVIPIDFDCVEVTNVEGTKTSKQCIPTSGHCECASDADYTSDPNHCGDCENRCFFPNATADCTNSECTMGGCLKGFVNLNNSPDDGCEYECLFQSPIDHPDPEFIDADCDGIDGDVETGVFVMIGGDDENFLGDILHPFATINAAMAFAASKNPIPEVYVAAGNYQEQVNLLNGVSVYGGYDSGNGWLRNFKTNVTTITWNGQETLAVRSVIAKDITEPTVFDGFNIKTVSSAQASGSSYGMHVSGCDSDLIISNNVIEAGNGMDGRNGTFGTNGQPGNNGTRGSDAFAYFKCALCVCTVFNLEENMKPGPGGSSPCNMTGGMGGRGGDFGDPGFSGTAGLNSGGYGGSGAYDVSMSGNPGGAGAAGTKGPDGSGGLATGEVNAGGLWIPSSGANGTDGTHGKGGGGGGGGGGDDDETIFSWECHSAGGAGGGGGGGGCGGTAGTGGQGGGGSFGLFLVQSSPQVLNNTIKSNFGGNGGVGGAAGTGGAGGQGGDGGSDTADGAGAGARGGNGGKGGDAGSGGGGPGGSSFPIYIVGNASKPTCTDNELGGLLYAGTGGYGGAGVSNKGADGASGLIFGVTANCKTE